MRITTFVLLTSQDQIFNLFLKIPAPTQALKCSQMLENTPSRQVALKAKCTT